MIYSILLVGVVSIRPEQDMMFSVRPRSRLLRSAWSADSLDSKLVAPLLDVMCYLQVARSALPKERDGVR
jgi:hypothetical protein